MDGKIFNVDELEVGVTAPPFHPNCGCTMVPYVEEEEEQEQETAPTKDQIIYDNRKLTIEEMQINAAYIYNYLIENGWTKNAICAILGNMQVESYLSPGVWENFDEGNMVRGFGLVQWTDAERFFKWAEKEDLDPYDIDTQLYRILQEVKIGTGEYYQWNSSKYSPEMTFREFTESELSPEKLAEIFMICYEQPQYPDEDNIRNRGNNAAYWYDYLN